MYLPEHFREQRPETLHQLMRQNPLAALITHGPRGLEANHVPLLLDAQGGVLRGHLARANTQWQGLAQQTEALAIFQGPDAYISPNWYPTKQEHRRVVPTWNYAVVHVLGELTVYTEPERLLQFLEQLTAEHESTEPKPWKPADAPGPYIEGQLRAIVGIELRIARIEGKWKMSQNQPSANQAGAAEALEHSGRADVAKLIRGEC
jgi:transcriptional regulator